ncbi:MAG: hypothetical protein Q4P83_09540 [Spirochaetales bacterium]|nr:hypothetical protein [Spirochaetales bacterium]
MTKTEVYNSDYTKLNHAYIVIYESYQKLVECKDADKEVLFVMENILRAFNPTLDRIKSEMTVQTRFKDENSKKSEDTAEKTQIKAEKSGFVVGSISMVGDDEKNSEDDSTAEKKDDKSKKGGFSLGGLFGKNKK